MSHRIQAVQPGSIADQLGILPGDELLNINGHKIVDWIDYQAFCASEQISLLVAHNDEQIEYEFEKDEYEPLGLEFSKELMSGVRNCCNHCLFCFVDQLPIGTRSSMHVKDDDWRLSLLSGNYVTLTNVGDKELERIIKRKASPLYISVHATDPALRSLLLGTPRAAGLMDQLRRLAKGGIRFHAQAVVCPGYNDGQVLECTAKDLAELYPACETFALVPVGLTNHRKGLTQLKPFDYDSANRLVDQVAALQSRFRERWGVSFIYAADEFYVLANRQTPPDDWYDGYMQIDNGIGLMRMLETDMEDAYPLAKLDQAQPGKVAIVTGESAAGFLKQLLAKYSVPTVDVTVHPVKNNFFGDSVTVAGLVTGSDIVAQFAEHSASYDRVLITQTMLRKGEDVFLDDMRLEQLCQALACPVIVVEERAECLLNAVAGKQIVEVF